MKKLIYPLVALMLTGYTMKSISNIITIVQKLSGSNENPEMTFGILVFYWEFIILGFVIAGIINSFDNKNFKIAARCNAFGGCLMLAAFGMMTGQHIIITTISSKIILIGFFIFCLGIAITIIELIIELYKTLRNK